MQACKWRCKKQLSLESSVSGGKCISKYVVLLMSMADNQSGTLRKVNLACTATSINSFVSSSWRKHIRLGPICLSGKMKHFPSKLLRNLRTALNPKWSELPEVHNTGQHYIEPLAMRFSDSTKVTFLEPQGWLQWKTSAFKAFFALQKKNYNRYSWWELTHWQPPPCKLHKPLMQ